MLLPFRSKNPPDTLPVATVVLIGINTIIFALTSNGLVLPDDVALQYGLSLNNVSPTTFLTSMFLHGDILHLLGNMWFLYLFGFAVEGRLRTAKFIVVYLAAGLAGNFLHLLLFGRMSPDIPLIGASGAIMGCLGAALYLFPFAQVNFVFGWMVYWRVVTWHMYWVAIYYLGFDILGALLSRPTGGGVAHLAHLGGAAGGILMVALFRAKRDTQEASEAKATLSETKDLTVLSSRELASLAQNQPDNSTIILNWMHRSLRDPYGIKPECFAAFTRLLPKIIQDEPAAPVGFVLAQLGSKPGLIPSNHLLNSAFKVERQGEFSLALRLLDCVLRDPQAAERDVESALFRAGILCETALNNPQRALSTYQEVIRRFPMSPIADQARSRGTALAARLPRT